jgi:ribosomal protein S18 acetylase RimI-like enzyme
MPTVRNAVHADAVLLASLAERTFRATFTVSNTPEKMDTHCAKSYGAAVQAREIADPRMRTLVCEDDGTLIGYGQLRWDAPQACVPAKYPARIQRLYVDAGFHGTGVAHALMSALLATAAAGGADQVWLGVWEQNPRALAFYRKFGFTVVGEHTFQFGNETQSDLVLSRPVHAANAGSRIREERP